MAGCCQYILDKHGYQLARGKSLPTKIYLDALHNTKGIDIRTVKKWTKLFSDAGYFKQLSAGAYEVLDSCYEFVSDIAEISEKQKVELK